MLQDCFLSGLSSKCRDKKRVVLQNATGVSFSASALCCCTDCAGKWSGETSLSVSFSSSNVLKWNRSPFSKLVWLWLIIFCHSFSVCVLRIRSNEWITMLVICKVCYQMWLACSYEIKSPVSLKQTTKNQTPPYSLDFNCIMVPELQDYCLWNFVRICFMCVIVPADDLWSF